MHRRSLWPRIGMLLVVGCATAFAACADRCELPFVHDQAASGEARYASKNGETLITHLEDDPLLNQPEGTNFSYQRRLIADGELVFSWRATSSEGDSMRFFRLSVGAPFEEGETSLGDASAQLCSCDGGPPSDNDTCSRSDGGSVAADCEPIHGTLQIDMLNDECVDAPDYEPCAEDVALRIEVPTRDGARFSGTLELVSVIDVEDVACGSRGCSIMAPYGT